MVGIMNLDKQITSFLTVELITDCEIVRISADVLRKLAMENIEISSTFLFSFISKVLAFKLQISEFSANTSSTASDFIPIAL